MRVAIIDIGTNAVRLEVYQCISGSDPELLHRDRRVLRLGNGLYSSGRLNPDATQSAIQAFREFREAIAELEVEIVNAVGTSALREAEDSDEFINAIAKDSDFSIRTISGEDEARLTARGILANEPELTEGCYALIDVGGGSTEFSVCEDRDIRFSTSVPLGAIRCQQRILQKSPPTHDSIAQLRSLAKEQFAVLKSQLPSAGLKRAIGSSGTARALSDLGLGQAESFRSELQAFIEQIQALSSTELLAIPGMKKNRADIILAGALLLESAMETLQVDDLAISRYSLRHGLLLETLEM